MIRAYRFRLQPTVRQHVALEQCLNDTRLLYNAALQARRGRWEWNSESTSFFTQSADLKFVREDPRFSRWAFTCECYALRRLDRAFQSFFRRVKAGQAPGFPRFKAAARWDTIEWQHGRGAAWMPVASRVRLVGIGHVKVSAHREVVGRVKTVTVKREGRRWFVILTCDRVPTNPLPKAGRVVGVDVGVASFATTSDGNHLVNPRYGRRAADDLAAAQRRLATKTRGSANRKRAVAVVANRHRKVRNQRLDFHHKTALKLVRQYDLIAIEDLPVANMVRAPKPRPDGVSGWLPNGAAAKAGLNRSISDAGWAQFRSILEGKAEDAGRTVVAVNPRHTSQTCHQCGHVDRENRVTQAEFRCTSCGHAAHADVNAALNILRAGLALSTPAGEQTADVLVGL